MMWSVKSKGTKGWNSKYENVWIWSKKASKTFPSSLLNFGAWMWTETYNAYVIEMMHCVGAYIVYICISASVQYIINNIEVMYCIVMIIMSMYWFQASYIHILRSGTSNETVCLIILRILSISVQIGICTECSTIGLWNHNAFEAPYKNELISVWAPYIVHIKNKPKQQEGKCICINEKGKKNFNSSRRSLSQHYVFSHTLSHTLFSYRHTRLEVVSPFSYSFQLLVFMEKEEKYSFINSKFFQFPSNLHE